MTDVIVIGGGPNGLTAAAFLAKTGLSILVLEGSDRPGGAARTGEIAQGFRCPTLAHAAAIDPAIVRALALERHGLEILHPAADVCSPGIDGRALVLWRDVTRAAGELRAQSPRDGDRYAAFVDSFGTISRVVRALCESTPPSIDDPSAGDLIQLLKAGRAFRSLGKADEYRLLRWLPMAAADFAGEWFESEPMRATVAASGVIGSFLGPWSAGSAAVLMLLGASDGRAVAPGWFARGGSGAVGDALANAARQAGATIRTTARVSRIDVKDGAATGVTLDNGEQLPARAVASSLDPKRTLLGMIDLEALEPEFVRRIQNIRIVGTLAKINFAVDALPRFAALRSRDAADQAAALSGRIRLARDIDAIERAFDAAKYGGFSREPWIELTIPSISDASLAPNGRHVVSAYVQYAPYRLRGTTWDAERDNLADAATRTIESYAPGFTGSIVARETITPLDLERTYGLTGGHIFHGELALDQLFVTRPVLGWAQYATPIGNLYLCGSGAHPGTGLNGRTGALAAKKIAADLRR
jgi:phytoene dehydrogenase-like protein